MVKDSDIFLVGHPKSGNTWLAFMLAVLVEKDNEEKVIGESVPIIHNWGQKICRHEGLRSPHIFRNDAPKYPEFYPVMKIMCYIN